MTSKRLTALVSSTLAFGLLAGSTVLAKADDAANWPMYGRNYSNTRYSPLTQINTRNVSKLKLAWVMSLGSLRSQESSPVVIDGTMYLGSSFGPKTVFAVDAATGQVKWTYAPDIPDDVLQYACCDVNNRGLTVSGGKVFIGRLDGKLTALDAKTGKELWTTTVVDYKQGSVITSPPLLVKDTVVTGFGGGEYGARGYLSAYNVDTGKQVWKTYTIPGPGEEGNDTWKGDSWEHGGGAPWYVGSYDPKTNTIFWGTSNPGPWNTSVRSTGTDNYGKLTNLYTASTLALDGDSGKIKWHVQATPADDWDYDGVNELVLANVKGQPVYMKADRNGFFYVVNRDSGKIISAEKYVPTNWANKIDVATGVPEENGKRSGIGKTAEGVCPNLIGGKNWHPMSYNPETGLVYIPSNNICMDWSLSEASYKRGVFYLGASFPTHPGPGGYNGQLIAWDPVHQKQVWGIKEDLPFNGGTMTTAGGLVFWGDIHGNFRAINARNGDVLWSKNLGSGIGAGSVTYEVGGKQYVAIVVGRNASIPAFLGDIGKQMTNATQDGGSVFVFSE